MNHQLTVGTGPEKRVTIVMDELETGSRMSEPLPEVFVDEEIDPADFFDPEEFTIRRRDSSSHQA